LFSLGGVVKLYPKFKIWVPLLIINNWNLNLLLRFSLSKLNLLIEFFIVFR
jgi:hypothetical protein